MRSGTACTSTHLWVTRFLNMTGEAASYSADEMGDDEILRLADFE
jgi:hypothetical protein